MQVAEPKRRGRPRNESKAATEQHMRELVARFQGGDSTAGDELLLENKGAIYRVVSRFLETITYDREDMAQEASVLVLRCAASFDVEGKTPWGNYLFVALYQTLRRRVGIAHDKDRACGRWPADGSYLDWLDQLALIPPQKVCESKPTVELLRELLGRLPDLERSLLELRWGLSEGEGKPATVAEIARRVGRSQAFVREQLANAEAVLKGYAADHMGGD